MKNHKRGALALVLAALLLVACGCGTSAGQNASSSAAAQAASSGTAASSYDYSAGLTDKGYFEGVTASDIVTLPEYKGITVSADLTKVSDEDVQTELNQYLVNYTTYDHITDRAIQDGDTVNIDYVGSVDGVAFKGGNTDGAGTDVIIGQTQYIDDFIAQLVGHKPGDTFDVNVTFPDPYEQNSDLSGKDAVFATTINYIQGEAHEAVLTDEIAADYGFESAEAMQEGIRSSMVMDQERKYVATLLADAKCEKIPQSVLDYIQNTDMAYYQSYADSYNVELDDFFASYVGYDSAAAYLKAQEETYQKNAIYALAAQAIAEKEKLSVSNDEIAELGYTDYVDFYGMPYVQMYTLENNVVPAFIFENAVTK